MAAGIALDCCRGRRVPAPEFVPIVAQERVAAGGSAVAIEIGDVVLRASPGVDLGFLGEVIRVLKAAA